MIAWKRLRVVAAGVALAAPARAQEAPPADPGADQRARELYQNGATLYEEGRYEDAVLAWQEAYRLSNRPILLYNIASAYERLGRYQDALDALYRYRAFAPASERETLDRRMKNIEQRLAAEVPPEPEPEPEPVAPPVAEEAGPRTFPLVMFSVGAAGLTSGTVFGLNALHARTEAADGCVRLVATGETYCSAGAEDALRRDRVDSWLADLSFAVGLTAVGIGTYAVLSTPLTVGVTPGSISLGGQF